MKNQKPLLILLGLALNAAPSPAQQQTNDPQQRALEMLRQTIAERERRRGVIVPTPTNAPVKKEPTFAEIEQQYLQSKITAKQFQKYLHDHKISVPPKTAMPTNTAALALEVLRQETAKVAAEPAGASTAPRYEGRDGPATGPDQTALTDVEKKMDELLRLKAAREQAALTNAAAATNATATAAPKTKRQRLDELLKLHIDGKIPEAEYNEKRSKIIAEPD